MAKAGTKIKPKQTTKKLLKDLKDRARYVITNRFGLEDGERRTLESIGQEYGITRERVRQIENFAITAIRKSDSFSAAREIFDDLKETLDELGGIVPERKLLDHISDDPVVQNHVHLYLVLNEDIVKAKEDSHFKSRWISNHEVAEHVHDALRGIHGDIKKADLVSEKELVNKVSCHDGICEVLGEEVPEDVVRIWLDLSKALSQNPLGEWGRADSPNVRTRGIKDYAYLIMRKHGSPMHFREVAEAITETFDKKTHVATCHNELIKDPRFVLVGRGVYALKDWGYRAGVVRDVIRDILEAEGPLTRDQIIERVLKERYLKRNTILVNLHNPKYFTKNDDGTYSVAE